MNVFTESRIAQSKIQSKDWRKEILDSIAYTGVASGSVKLSLINSVEQILDFSPGTPRIKRSIADKFTMITSQPLGVSESARCSLCGKRIIFPLPCWYHVIKYKVNHLAVFVCFDSSSPSKPTTRCYKVNNEK